MFRSIHVAFIFFAFACLSACAYGQDAQIQGRVLDKTGAAIPGATPQDPAKITLHDHVREPDAAAACRGGSPLPVG